MWPSLFLSNIMNTSSIRLKPVISCQSTPILSNPSESSCKLIFPLPLRSIIRKASMAPPTALMSALRIVSRHSSALWRLFAHISVLSLAFASSSAAASFASSTLAPSATANALKECFLSKSNPFLIDASASSSASTQLGALAQRGRASPPLTTLAPSRKESSRSTDSHSVGLPSMKLTFGLSRLHMLRLGLSRLQRLRSSCLLANSFPDRCSEDSQYRGNVGAE
mmetsp:Transcript_72182/g.114056  ORF Transcript_72182/g.114056 Transcript_72182/m.114056 type:complete len:224 (-) Transcript_72182:435-1106(-)